DKNTARRLSAGGRGLLRGLRHHTTSDHLGLGPAAPMRQRTQICNASLRGPDSTPNAGPELSFCCSFRAPFDRLEPRPSCPPRSPAVALGQRGQRRRGASGPKGTLPYPPCPRSPHDPPRRGSSPKPHLTDNPPRPLCCNLSSSVRIYYVCMYVPPVGANLRA
ncbi:hypothetical protein BDY21DRAFT_352751, partial [Lineolata rhizophorae]